MELTTDEMRYACGYVPHKLLKRYEARSGAVYSQYVQCLGDMAVEGEGDEFATYSRRWFDQVNRGGLFPLNDTLFVEIEKCVRVVLPKHIIQGDSDKATFKKSVLDVIVNNEDVQFYWVLLSQDIDDVEHAESVGDNPRICNGCIMDGREIYVRQLKSQLVSASQLVANNDYHSSQILLCSHVYIVFSIVHIFFNKSHIIHTVLYTANT